MVELWKASNEEIAHELKRREEEEMSRKRKRLFSEVEDANEDNRITGIYRDDAEDKIVYHIYVTKRK